MQKIIKVTLLLLAASFIFSTLSFSQTQEVISYLCEMGMNYYNQAKYDDALVQFKSVLLLEPNNKTARDFSERIILEKDIVQKRALTQADSNSIGNYNEVSAALDEYKDTRKAYSNTKEGSVQDKPSPSGNILGKKSPGDYVSEAVNAVEKKLPVELSGEYRVGFGVTSEDFIWKKANADKEGVPREKNYRYLWGEQGYNTYDEKIFDKLRMDLVTKFKSPFNVGTQIVLDPWSFIGHAKVTVSSTVAGVDSVDLNLKYWSNTGRTLNEIYRTDLGNIINLNEIKVVDNKTTPATVIGFPSWFINYNNVPQTEIDRIYRPVRKLFADYTQTNYKLHVFPISDESEALTTDDPLRLSNNHVYWEESPWIDSYEASRVFTRPGSPLKTGRWIRRWSYVARESSDDYPHYLTFLRGMSFTGDFGPVTLEAVTAAPLDFWNEYQQANTSESALRLKYPWNEDLTFGLIYTNKLGLVGSGIEAVNNVWGADTKFQVAPYTNLFGEFAGSTFDASEVNGVKTSYNGLAASLGIDFKEPEEQKKGFYRGKIYVSHLDKDFSPGLSNYRFTRRDDSYWSRNIIFGKLSYEDQSLVYGDGTDRGRTTVGMNTGIKSFNDKVDTRFDLRNVHSDTGAYIETVGRLESTAKWGDKLTSKVLGYYQHLPKTHEGYDPIIYTKTIYNITDFFSEDDSHPLNTAIEGGKDPSVGSFGLGLQYDFTNAISWEGIYERTNDPLDFPRSLLNDFFVTDEMVNGVLYDKVVPFLYDQFYFGLPPYDYYNIYKTKFTWWPLMDILKLTLSYTKNDNKFATGIDDNVNHIGLEMDYALNKKWNFWAKYTYSKIVDLHDLVVNSNFSYSGHNNVFLGVRYNLREDESFTFLFGEFVGYDSEYLDSNWTLSTVDTQHLFRFFYKKTF